MADARTQYRSAFRGARASSDAVTPPSISYPVTPRRAKGAFNPAPKANVQAQALEPAAAPAPATEATPSILQLFPSALQQEITGAYGAGGFDAMKKMPGWYDLPEFVRRQIMEGVYRG